MARADGWLAATAIGSLAAVGAALFTQYQMNMQPCPWCVLQRLIFVLIAVAAIVGLVWRSSIGRRIGAALGLALAGCGIAAALWQHFVAAASASCNLTLADRIIAGLGLDEQLPSVFMAMATCADAAVKLLGLSYEFWSLGLFVLAALAMLQVLRRPA